ncbi:ABC transporter substrate-binding protein [Occultella aeris]|uniref:NMT1/THI5 like protein n=1 Tax=Occultella aeris TaxID=2761496 RepID=A0A7M4DRE7_9MICO|nr:ABC transporter substrate-binding protein [Occultella aeris]VZO40041.1 NMT1/THI5 like protein [Occultella aeris]
MLRTSRPAVALTCAGGLALILASCSGGAAGTESETDGGADSTSSGPVTVRVSTLGFCDDPIVWGIDQGIFAEHGIEVELTTVQSGAAGVSALQAGEIDIAYANPLTSLQAIDTGIDLQILSGSSLSNETSNEVIVLADSDIQGAADLDGTTIALNALGGLAEILTAAWVATEGDGAAVEFVAVPFADQVTSVENGTVASAEIGASQGAAAHEAGTIRSLGNPFFDGVGEIPTSFYVAPTEWTEANPDAAVSFAEAMTEVAASANDDANDEARFAVTAQACGSTAEDLAASAEPTYAGRLTVEQFETLTGLLADAEVIGAVDTDAVLPESARA